MDNAWIYSVLEDIREFAELNGLSSTARALLPVIEEAKALMHVELNDESAPQLPCDEATASISHASPSAV